MIKILLKVLGILGTVAGSAVAEGASDIGIYIPKRWVPPKKLLWEPSISFGLNATQVKVSNSADEYTSEGYLGFVAGAGVALFPKPYLAFQGDVFYSSRIFGFGSSKGFFNTWQIPLTAQLRAGNVSVGGGVYTAFWRAIGRMEESGTKVLVSTDSAGNNLTEFGYLGQIAITTKFGKLPIRFEFRGFRSLSDIAKSPELMGTLSEYQLLVGFDFTKG